MWGVAVEFALGLSCKARSVSNASLNLQIFYCTSPEHQVCFYLRDNLQHGAPGFVSIMYD